jgi:hypothetical protein
MCSPFGFSIKQNLVCLFYCQKITFVCEFEHTPLRKMIFFSMSHTLVNMRFCKHVPNSPSTKILKRPIPYLLKKMVFWPPKFCYPPSTQGEKN